MASKESEQTVTSTLQSPLSQERNKEMTETEKSLQSQGVASVFDPTKDAPARNVTLGPAPVAEVDLSDIRSFVSRTCHQESGTVQCQIMREKSSMLNMLGSDRGEWFDLQGPTIRRKRHLPIGHLRFQVSASLFRAPG